MDLIVFNDPADLPWQTNLCDLMLLAMFLAAVAYSVVQFRRGRRIAALRPARPPVPIERFTVGLVLIYVACLAAMAIGNVVYEGALTQYMVVQTVGLVVMSALAIYPLRASRRGQTVSSPQRPAVAASARDSR
jgi:hypothetical protein